MELNQMQIKFDSIIIFNNRSLNSTKRFEYRLLAISFLLPSKHQNTITTLLSQYRTSFEHNTPRSWLNLIGLNDFHSYKWS